MLIYNDSITWCIYLPGYILDSERTYRKLYVFTITYFFLILTVIVFHTMMSIVVPKSENKDNNLGYRFMTCHIFTILPWIWSVGMHFYTSRVVWHFYLQKAKRTWGCIKDVYWTHSQNVFISIKNQHIISKTFTVKLRVPRMLTESDWYSWKWGISPTKTILILKVISNAF